MCLLVFLSPLFVNQRTHGPWFICAAVILSGALGYLVGSREDGLKALAALDPVTGLSNRRHLEPALRAEIDLARRHRHPLALLLIDVDGLKSINDALGHAAGDRALRAVADALGHACRKNDLVARWGSDEFVVVAPITNEVHARALADRIASTLHLRSAAQRVVLLGEAGALPALSVSIGVAAVNPDQPNLLEPQLLFAQADRALRAARVGGPGHVQVCSPRNRSLAFTDWRAHPPRPRTA